MKTASLFKSFLTRCWADKGPVKVKNCIAAALMLNSPAFSLLPFTMKAFYLIGSIILTVTILIIAFGNIQSDCTNLILFFHEVDQSPTIIILAVSVLGIMTGAMYHAFVARVLANPENEEEQNF